MLADMILQSDVMLCLVGATIDADDRYLGTDFTMAQVSEF